MLRQLGLLVLKSGVRAHTEMQDSARAYARGDYWGRSL